MSTGLLPSTRRWVDSGASVAHFGLAYYTEFLLFIFLNVLVFHSRENMNEASRTVTVRCVSQTAAAGLCSVRLYVWGRRDDLEMPMSVSRNVFSPHHKYVVNLGLQSKGNIASDFLTVWFWATCVCCLYPNRTGKWATWPRISPINWVSRSAKLTSVRRLSPPPQKERIMGRRHHPLERLVIIAKQNRTIWVKGVHSYCKNAM